MSTISDIVNKVSTRKEAELVVSILLKRYSSDAAYDRVIEEAFQIKQKPQEVWKRKVANLFRSLSTRRG